MYLIPKLVSTTTNKVITKLYTTTVMEQVRHHHAYKDTIINALSTTLYSTSGNAATFRCPAPTDFMQTEKNNPHHYLATSDGVQYQSGYIPAQGAEGIQVYDDAFSHYMDCYYGFPNNKEGFKARSTNQKMFTGTCTVKTWVHIKLINAPHQDHVKLSANKAILF